MGTQTEYHRATAFALDDLLVCTASGGSSTTAILGELINSDATASANRFDWNWLYGVTGFLSGVQRTLTRGTYAPSTGTVTVTPGWTAPVAATVYDLTKLFPRGNAILQGDPSYRTLALAASRRLNIRREITVTIGTAQRLALTTWVNWIRAERVLNILEPSPRGRLMPTWREWHIVEGTTPTLHLRQPFDSATGTLVLEVVSPAYSWVATSGTFAESTVGLTNETDELLVPVADMRAAMLVEALTALKARGRTRPVGSDADDLKYWQDYCAENIRDYDFGEPKTPGVTTEVAA